MSGPENVNGVTADPFEARFGVAAGAQAPEAERRQWEQLCRELLQERDRLREELAASQAKCERYKLYLRAWSQDSMPSAEEEAEFLKHVDDAPTADQLLAELDRLYAADL